MQAAILVPLKGECINQNQEMVAQGIYHQYLDKKFFELGE